MYNIKKAVSRLEFAPKLDEIKVSDIKRGLGDFTPRADKLVSFAALKEALKKAGYRLDSARITVEGALAQDATGWWLETEPSKQRFAIETSDMLKDLEPGARVEVSGDWRTLVEGKSSRESIHVREARRLSRESNAPRPPRSAERAALSRARAGRALSGGTDGIQVSLQGTAAVRGIFLAPVRTTSPGLAVYKGGALTSRYGYTRQHLGALKVDRHSISLAASYTPTPFLQLEIEAPFHRTSFEEGNESGSGYGAGNVTLWSKYRFYRALETWGDRQAALRIGVELPTGKGRSSGRAGNLSRAGESGFLQGQLGPASGGLSLHADAAYSQAKGRVIFGGNVEGVV
ncbi:MAG TPA: hypothetical protein VKC34_04010, partial [Blastocatellia bacterium]|nr:hypothetical protein [Blastocatellia bacterium]